MTKIRLHDHPVHPWHAHAGLHVRGWFFHAGDFYEGPDALGHLADRRGVWTELLPVLNGAFAVVDQRAEGTLIAVDRLRTFPLLIARLGEHHLVTDRVEVVPGVDAPRSIDPTTLREYVATGYVTGSRTLYPHITQVEAGQLVTVRGKALERHDYYRHEHRQAPTTRRSSCRCSTR